MVEHTQHKNSAGFTLLEVMVAVMLLGLSYVAVLESFSVSMQRLVKLDSRLEEFFNQDTAMLSASRFTGPTLNYEETEGEVIREGSIYLLSTIRSEGGLLQSLELRKK